MPNPTDKFSFDALVTYPLVDKISKNLCGVVSPNFITLVNLFVSQYAVRLAMDRPCSTLLLRVLFLRFVLDCLDGSIARTCKSSSLFGSRFDLYNDWTFHALIIIVLMARYQFSLLSIGVVALIGFFIAKSSSWSQFLHDNSTLIKPIAYFLLTCNGGP